MVCKTPLSFIQLCTIRLDAKPVFDVVVSHDDVTRMQELVPTARVTELPDAGHDAHLDALDDWLAGLSP